MRQCQWTEKYFQWSFGHGEAHLMSLCARNLTIIFNERHFVPGEESMNIRSLLLILALVSCASSAMAGDVCHCKGYAGPGGPCYAGPGGPAYNGPGGPAYAGPGGPCSRSPGGERYDGPGGSDYDGPGGPRYAGPGGPAYDGPGGPAYSGPGGPCYGGPGGACYSGPGGTGEDCPSVCR